MTMDVVVVGSGYIGLVSDAYFAEFGWQITCVDADEIKVASLCKGEIPIYESDLEDLVEKNMLRGSLRFSADLAGPVHEADVVFLAKV